MKLSVIIPTYNEEKTVKEVVERVLKLDIDLEVIVVDDGSNDKTKEKLAEIKDKKVKVLRHKRNKGKGRAIRTGIKKAKGEYVIIQDADFEYDPEDILKLLAPVKKGKAEVVYGSRFTGERRNMFFWHFVGNRFLTLLTNILYNTTISDMETGYKLIKTSIIKGIKLNCQKFEFEPEITAKILKKGIRIYEVPISYSGREYEEGKKITWRDGFPAMFALIKYRFID